MKEEPTRTVQLLLNVPLFSLEGISDETRRRLVAELGDLLLSVAANGGVSEEGRSDEREDP